MTLHGLRVAVLPRGVVLLAEGRGRRQWWPRPIAGGRSCVRWVGDWAARAAASVPAPAAAITIVAPSSSTPASVGASSRSSAGASTTRLSAGATGVVPALPRSPQASGQEVGAAAAREEEGSNATSATETGILTEDGEIPPEVADLFDTLRGEALRRLEEFAPIHLFSLCWAYSTARLLDEDLQRQICAAALRLGGARDRDAAADAGAGTRTRATLRRPVEEDGEREVEEGSPDEEEWRRRESPSILAETDHWLALFKPPFWLVTVDSREAAKAATATPFEDEDYGDGEDEFAVEDNRKRPRVQRWIRQNLADKYPIGNNAIEAFGLLHRLDVQTSGILLMAKTYVGMYWLRLQWCSYNVEKEYICLVHGWVDRSTREIHKRIRIDKKKAENSRRTVSTICSVSPSGKPSYTELCTLAHLVRCRRGPHRVGGPGGDGGEGDEESKGEADGEERYSLVALKLHTGRTHQIRVHMLSIGHPLVCDAKYAEDLFGPDRMWCPRNFLHTYRLAFEDLPEEEEGSAGRVDADVGARGSGGRLVEVMSPLPEDLRSALALCEPVDEASIAAYADWMSGETERLRAFDAYGDSSESCTGIAVDAAGDTPCAEQ